MCCVVSNRGSMYEMQPPTHYDGQFSRPIAGKAAHLVSHEISGPEVKLRSTRRSTACQYSRDT